MTEPDLAAWLLEQLAEDERRAHAMAAQYPTPWDVSDRGWMAHVVADGPHFHEVTRVEQHQVAGSVSWLADVVEHVATWNPDRVLAECDAKRRIIFEHRELIAGKLGQKPVSICHACKERRYPCTTLRLLALPYADRPGYREEWRP